MTPGDELAGFRLVEVIGAGGMGQVWKAVDMELKRCVALKFLPDDLATDADRTARLQREAEVLASLNHSNVAMLHAIRRASVDGVERQFLVMELVDGKTLRDHLARGRLETADALAFAGQIAAALGEAHRMGIVHRDLKPENVMVTDRGRVKVLDFGIAKPVRRQSADAATSTWLGLTRVGEVVGTVPYMSPEQFRGDEVDARTDLWALGCVTFEMLSGRRPFEGDSPAAVLQAVLGDRRPWSLLPPDVPTSVRSTLERCLATRPEDRPQTAQEVESAMTVRAGGGHRRARQAASVLAVVGLSFAAWWILGPDGGSAGAEVRALVALPTEIQGEIAEAFQATPAALSSHLAGIPGVSVRFPPPTEPELAKLQGDLGKVARIYGVDAFLMSSIARDRQQVFLRVQLVRSQGRELVWAGQFRGDGSDSESLSMTAARTLREEVWPAMARAEPPVPAPGNTAARAQLRLASHYVNLFSAQPTEERFGAARSALQRSLELDPASADAAAWTALLFQYRYGVATEPEYVDDLLTWADLALELGPKSAMAAVAQSLAASHRQGPVEAVRWGIRAARLAPDDDLAQYTLGFWLSSMLPTLGAPHLERSLELNPIRLSANIVMSSMAVAMAQSGGRYFEVARDMEPRHPFVRQSSVHQALVSGDCDEAGRLLRGEVDDPPGVPVPPVNLEAFGALVRLCSATQVGAASDVELATLELAGLLPSVTSYFGQEIYASSVTTTASSGFGAHALRLLAEGDANPAVRLPADWFALHPALESIRSDPQFGSLREQARERARDLLRVLEESQNEGALPFPLGERLQWLRDELR